MTSKPIIFVSSIAALGGLLFGYDTAVISGTVESLRQHFALSPLALGWVVGSALIAVAGAALSGTLTVRFGRRLAFFRIPIVISDIQFLVCHRSVF